MRRFILPFAILTVLFGLFQCDDREDYFAETHTDVDVTVTSDLTACTESYPGFMQNAYNFKVMLTPKYKGAHPFPIVATYTCEIESTLSSGQRGTVEIKAGNKRYAESDTMVFASAERNLTVTPNAPGRYRLKMEFTYGEKTTGTYELNFVIGAPDLIIQIIRDGKQVENLNTFQNFNEASGEFTVRVVSEKELLSKGRLALTTNIKGSSVRIANWKDNEKKVSQDNDLDNRVDFAVSYQNVQLGTTSFTFTAQTANATAIKNDSITVVETIPGSLSLNTAYDEENKFYSRDVLWIGQTDSVEYVIQPDPNSTGNNFKWMFETKDPDKLKLFDTGNPEQQTVEHLYLRNMWYDFADLTGKIYYVFPSPTTYSDTVFISMKNGEMGKVTKYKLFVSAKQSDDFDFNVTFKPELTKEYDVIKMTELLRGSIIDPIVLSVTDQNPYSEFDYMLSWQEMNYKQLTIKQAFQKEGHPLVITDVYGDWLVDGRNSYFDVLKNTKEFFVIVSEIPTNFTAEAFIGEFNWVYTIKRLSDGIEKTVTRQIKIIDDRLNFNVGMATNGTQSVFQNQQSDAFQILYDSPSNNSSQYQMKVTSTNPGIADVYVMNADKEMTFRKIDYDTFTDAPASHLGTTEFNSSVASRIQIKGKAVGEVELKFTLKHKTSETEKIIEKTVSTLPDEVRWEMAPAAVKDLTNVERNTVANGTEFHQYQNPRIRVRVKGESDYAGNHNGKAVIRISGDEYTAVRVDNAPKEYDTDIEVNYDQDYYITIHPTGMKLNSDGGWNTSSGTQTISVTAQKGNEQDVPIISIAKSYSASVREYRKSNLTWTHASLSTLFVTMDDHWNIAYCGPRMIVGPYVVIMDNYGGCVTVRSATTASTTANVTLNKAVVSGGDAVDIRENTAGSFAAQYWVNEFRGDRLENSSGQAVAGNTLGERSYHYEWNCTDVWGRPYTLSFNHKAYY